MDALPRDPRQTSIMDIVKLFAVASVSFLVITIPLAGTLAGARFIHIYGSGTLLAVASVFGFLISAGVVIASLEGVAVGCRTVILVAIVSALAVAISSCFHHSDAVIYEALPLSAGVAVGAVSIWSERRAGWKLMSAILTTGVIVALATFLYWVTQRWIDHPVEIVAPVILLVVITAWVLQSQDPNISIGEGIRVASPIPILIGVIAAFALQGNPDANTWYYQLWVGLLVGASVPVSDYAVGGAAGRSSILATPLIWAIVSHPGVAFGHLGPKEWPTMAICGVAGSILGGLVAYVWRPAYLHTEFT